jgi:TDG/mug DNA glycosylase family protein
MMYPNSFRYEQIDPRVQEISILATMHNMASLLQDSEPLKSVISEELAKRAARLSKS